RARRARHAVPSGDAHRIQRYGSGVRGNMPNQLGYVIEFVADMDRAVRFYRDVLGLPLKFQSPEWSEFATGTTTLALHPASAKSPAGKVELGFTVPDLDQFHQGMTAREVQFTVAAFSSNSWIRV